MQTKQEVFDYVVGALRRQGVGSYNSVSVDEINCRYRDDAGNKCAAGHLISDAEYLPMMEGASAPQVGADFLSPEHVINQHCDLVLSLQRAHDNSCRNSCRALGGNFLESFEHAARLVAWMHGLKYTPPGN